ncbi:MAG: carboxymuconolactone decarboxylase family protein [Planctomycetes bacterium]|nr:carboxymuconolactone decarboxylase family protein [Planctomycetota bacterium]
MNSDDSTPPQDDALAQLAEAGCLDATQRALCLALALGAAGRFAQLEDLCRSALARGVALSCLREAALMVHLFAGFPAAIETFHALERAAGRLPPPDPGADVPEEERGERGRELFARIYQGSADSVLEVLRSFAPAFAHAVLEDAYGRILARPGLDARQRELMAVCALTASGLPRQLRSHLRGALSCGATPDDVHEAIALARAVAPARRAAAAEAELRALLAAP